MDIIYNNFCWGRWGSSLTGLRTLNTLLSPTSTPAEIFWRTCLGGGRGVPQILYYPKSFRSYRVHFLFRWWNQLPS